MPLRWRSRPRFDGMAAGERSLAGQERPFNEQGITPLARLLCYPKLTVSGLQRFRRDLTERRLPPEIWE